MDVAYAEETEAIGFASILTAGDDTELKSKKCHGKGKGKKRAGVAAVSMGAGV